MMDFEQWNLDHDQLKQIADSLERIAACVDGREDSRFSPLAVKWIFADEQRKSRKDTPTSLRQ